MQEGDKIVLAEGIIVVDALGTDYLLKGTVGTVKEVNGDMLDIETRMGTYAVPIASIILEEDKAA